MSEQSMKILRMLEEGKLNVEQASELLSKLQDLEEEGTESEPDRHHHARHQAHTWGATTPGAPRVDVPPVPPVPDIGRIIGDTVSQVVGDTMRSVFGNVSGSHSGPSRAEVGSKQFRGARLEHTDLSDAKLEGARLGGADLRYANLVDADLRDADLRGANLSYSDLTDADLHHADLRGANMSYGAFVNAAFQNADLHGADLSYSDLTDADFSGVKEPGLHLRGVSMVGMRYPEANGVDTAVRGAEKAATREPKEDAATSDSGEAAIDEEASDT